MSRETRQHAHDLIDRMVPVQVAAVVRVMEVMLDPVARTVANAPVEDEEISEEETRAVAASKAWLLDHQPIANEEVLAEFGLTADDFDRMSRTPVIPTPHSSGQ